MYRTFYNFEMNKNFMVTGIRMKPMDFVQQRWIGIVEMWIRADEWHTETWE